VLEKGRVIGIEVDLKPQNRDAIRTGPLASSISLVDGSSVDANTLAAVRAQIRTGEKGWWCSIRITRAITCLPNCVPMRRW
jgi:cephalosporin hydroxylase